MLEAIFAICMPLWRQKLYSTHPVGLKPYKGRDLVCLMLNTAAEVFEDFEYHRILADDKNAFLEFSAHTGDEQLKAAHIIHFNAAGKFSDIEKMVRPGTGAQSFLIARLTGCCETSTIAFCSSPASINWASTVVRHYRHQSLMVFCSDQV
jgi:hypothetical protein